MKLKFKLWLEEMNLPVANQSVQFEQSHDGLTYASISRDVYRAIINSTLEKSLFLVKQIAEEIKLWLQNAVQSRKPISLDVRKIKATLSEIYHDGKTWFGQTPMSFSGEAAQTDRGDKIFEAKMNQIARELKINFNSMNGTFTTIGEKL